MRRLALLALLIALVAPGAALAVEPDEMLKDPALEARARHLSEGLRCLVCQNQSIDDSNAPLAADLRRAVRERLVAGDSDPQVLDFLVRRYGDYVLMTPPMRPSTYALWFGAPLLLLLAAGGLVMSRRRSTAAPTAPLSADEERRLAGLLDKR